MKGGQGTRDDVLQGEKKEKKQRSRHMHGLETSKERYAHLR